MVEIFDDIRKIYNFSAPCPELSNYIEFFSESSFEETYKCVADNCFTVKMFPSWTPTFYINLGSPYYLSIGKVLHLVSADDDVLILRDSIVERHNLPTDHIFTVKFFPGGLEAVFGINQTKFISRIVDLKTILPSQLLYNVKTAATFEKKVELLQRFFLESCKTKVNHDYYLKFVQSTIETYKSGKMQFNNSEVAEKMFATSKTINRYFLNVIGTAPKNYFSIMRARNALTAYVENKKYFDPSDYGYYDMSHFYKEVVKFTGQKLTGFQH